MPDPVVSEIKYLGNGDFDILEVRVPDDYPSPGNLRLVIYDRNHDGSNSAMPAASDIHIVTDGLLYTEDTDMDGNDDDGILHYTFGSSEDGTNIFLHALDAVGLYDVVTGETFGLYSWGSSSYTVSTATGDPFAGQTATLLDSSGQIRDVTSLTLDENGDYVLANPSTPGTSYICFTTGTQILTVNGERAVQDLCVGDEVITKDLGAQKIRWIGQRRFAGPSAMQQDLQPITIKAHAFGQNVPSRDTKLSPNHAILNDHWKASLLFGDDEILTAAKSLLTADYAYRNAQSAVTYYHVLLDQHSLILANGMWSESLYLGSQCMEMLSARGRREIFDLFPQYSGNLEGYGQKARQFLKPKEAALLV